MKEIEGDKHSSLFQRGVNYSLKKFYSAGPQILRDIPLFFSFGLANWNIYQMPG
jgi:hypothetical protein